MTQINRRVLKEIERWGNLFRSKKAKVQRQGRTVAQVKKMATNRKSAQSQVEAMLEDYRLTKSLLLK